MFTVDEIYDEGKKIVGSCDDPLFFRWVTDAIALIANKGEFEGWKGYVDICTTCEHYVTLPREVQTVLGITLDGNPALGRNELFSFHLNGPGERSTKCEWIWTDQGYNHATYRDIGSPAKLAAFVDDPEDNGVSVVVHGFDSANRPLWHTVGGEQRRGYPLPTIYGYAIPDSGMPDISRVTAVVKARTKASVRVSTIDNDGFQGTLLGVYEPDELVPRYRRIKLNRAANWVRLAYRKTNPRIDSKYDHIPLQSRLAFLLALNAVRRYRHEDLAEAHTFEADAVRMELEAQEKTEAPLLSPPQIVDLNNPQDKDDFNIL